jgi:hypothetical protein
LFDALRGARAGPCGAAALGHSPLEALDATAGVDQLLPAGIERMAGGTDLNVDFGLGRAGRELVAAGAADVSFYILGMYTGLHGVIECSGRDLRPDADSAA